jgi:hypothetical protein
MAAWRQQISLVVMLILTAVLIESPTVALAQPPPICHVDRMFVEATHVGQQGNHKGIKANVLKAAPTNDCARISTVNVLNGFNGFIEWGWSLGYLWSTAEGGDCPATVYHSSPERFVVWRPNNGSIHCRPNEGALVSGGRKEFKLRDENQNTVWTYSFDGIDNGTVDVNFYRGIVVTSSERHRAADSAYAEFYTIKLQITGDNTFYSFNLDQNPGMDIDDDYNCRQVALDDEEVRVLPDTC